VSKACQVITAVLDEARPIGRVLAAYGGPLLIYERLAR
jgi:hypothetical protein